MIEWARDGGEPKRLPHALPRGPEETALQDLVRRPVVRCSGVPMQWVAFSLGKRQKNRPRELTSSRSTVAVRTDHRSVSTHRLPCPAAADSPAPDASHAGRESRSACSVRAA